MAFSKVFLKAKTIRKVVVPCGCSTAQFELERNEEKKFQNLGLGSGLFLTQTELFLAQIELFLAHNNYKSRPTEYHFSRPFGPHTKALVPPAFGLVHGGHR